MLCKIRSTEKQDLRLRVPIWVIDELVAAAEAAGIRDKPAPAAATQILEQWAARQAGDD